MPVQFETQYIQCHGGAEKENDRISEPLSLPLDKVYQLHWVYNQTTIALGRSQKVNADMLARAKKANAGVFQRLSGGGAVITSENLISLTTLLPLEHPLAKLDLIQCFKAVGDLWQKALARQGISTRLCTKVDKGPSSLNWICFAGASHGELFDEKGRKLLGLAQVRKRNGIAIMAGIYLSQINWEVLFNIFQGGGSDDDLATIKHATTSIEEQGTLMSPQSQAAMIEDYIRQCGLL